jgi:hypothetical protein
LRSHSMASKPRIVRHAVWKERNPPTRGIARFNRKWSLPIPCCRCLVTWWAGGRGSTRSHMQI